MKNYRNLLGFIVGFLAPLAIAAGPVPTNTLRLGDGANSNKTILFNTGSATPPKVRWNSASSQFEFTNDGTNYAAFGSGSGSGQGIELIPNPGFEAGVSNGWSVTGGTLAAVTAGSDLIFDKTTAAFTASGSGQILETSAITIKGLSGGGCEASIYYLYAGSSGDYSLIAYDGTNVLGTLSLPPNSVASTPVAVYFPCGGATTSTLQLQIKSNVASPSTIYVDNAHLGSNGVFQVSQAKELGSVTITACAASFTTTSTTYADFGTEASCVYTTTGAALAPATNLPAIKFASIPAGTIAIDYEGGVEQATQGHIAYFQFTDGTTTADETSTVQTATGGSLVVPGIHQTIRYTTAQSNVTFKLQAKTDSGGTAEVTGGTAVPGTIRVRFYPASTSQAFVPNLVQSFAAVQFPGGGSVNTTSATFANVNSAGLASPSVFGRASSAAIANDFGMQVAQVVPGTYKVSTNARLSNGGTGGDCEMQLYDVTNATQLGIVNSGNGVQYPTGGGLAAVVKYAAFQSSLNLVLRYRSISGATCTIDEANTGTMTPVLIFEPMNQNVTAPVVIGQITSSSAGQELINRAAVTSSCTSSPCTIASQSGSWLSSITRTTTGTYVANIAASTFSAAPACWGQTLGGNSFFRIDSTSSSTVNFETQTIVSPALADSSFNFFCTGPH